MKKVLSLGLATALAVGALSGCGGGKPGGSEKGSGAHGVHTESGILSGALERV